MTDVREKPTTTSPISTRKHGDVLMVLSNNPPVNALSTAVRQGLVDAISGLSFLTHFAAIAKGVIDVRDLVYFALTIAFWLYASAVVIDLKKAD